MIDGGWRSVEINVVEYLVDDVCRVVAGGRVERLTLQLLLLFESSCCAVGAGGGGGGDGALGRVEQVVDVVVAAHQVGQRVGNRVVREHAAAAAEGRIGRGETVRAGGGGRDARGRAGRRAAATAAEEQHVAAVAAAGRDRSADAARAARRRESARISAAARRGQAAGKRQMLLLLLLLLLLQAVEMIRGAHEQTIRSGKAGGGSGR